MNKTIGRLLRIILLEKDVIKKQKKNATENFLSRLLTVVSFSHTVTHVQLLKQRSQLFV